MRQAIKKHNMFSIVNQSHIMKCRLKHQIEMKEIYNYSYKISSTLISAIMINIKPTLHYYFPLNHYEHEWCQRDNDTLIDYNNIYVSN